MNIESKESVAVALSTLRIKAFNGLFLCLH